jgi:hypothetical protein
MSSNSPCPKTSVPSPSGPTRNVRCKKRRTALPNYCTLSYVHSREFPLSLRQLAIPSRSLALALIIPPRAPQAPRVLLPKPGWTRPVEPCFFVHNLASTQFYVMMPRAGGLHGVRVSFGKPSLNVLCGTTASLRALQSCSCTPHNAPSF